MSYWSRRRKLRYYRVARRLIQETGPGGKIIDVGGWNTPVCTYGDFRWRQVINSFPVDPMFPGVKYLIMDWMDYDGPQADVVTCLQVLEHIQDDTVEEFCQRLFRFARRRVIISVPFMWRGPTEEHPQDPVSFSKLFRWTKRHPDWKIITGARWRRLVCSFDL